MEDKTEIIELFKKKLEEKNMSLKLAADIAGTTHQTLSTFINEGKLSLDLANKLEEIMNMPVGNFDGRF